MIFADHAQNISLLQCKYCNIVCGCHSSHLICKSATQKKLFPGLVASGPTLHCGQFPPPQMFAQSPKNLHGKNGSFLIEESSLSCRATLTNCSRQLLRFAPLERLAMGKLSINPDLPILINWPD
ncbi:hypothetical protein M413DRAFT_176168 [Hebeloma cylindrosporum]|uniref:Uncharacterized protein n=1 Tax=Hebeloma cylindrosporum TaxID=76867 RepID=A0A0C2YGR3_HEBCY|nr:hypothetical protein M413DRAFT_176168 [Hebeloma cylindrosporum h7]